jgi:hypothetical protein
MIPAIGVYFFDASRQFISLRRSIFLAGKNVAIEHPTYRQTIRENVDKLLIVCFFLRRTNAMRDTLITRRRGIHVPVFCPYSLPSGSNRTQQSNNRRGHRNGCASTRTILSSAFNLLQQRRLLSGDSISIPKGGPCVRPMALALQRKRVHFPSNEHVRRSQRG